MKLQRIFPFNTEIFAQIFLFKYIAIIISITDNKETNEHLCTIILLSLFTLPHSSACANDYIFFPRLYASKRIITFQPSPPSLIVTHATHFTFRIHIIPFILFFSFHYSLVPLLYTRHKFKNAFPRRAKSIKVYRKIPAIIESFTCFLFAVFTPFEFFCIYGISSRARASIRKLDS